MRSSAERDPKRGGALLLALALLALAGALLAGSAQAARAIQQSLKSYGAAVTVESASQTALAEIAASWPSVYDSLEIGASTEGVIGPRRVGTAGLIAYTRFRVLRLSAVRFVVGIESSVGPEGVKTARRRLSLLLERRPRTDTSTTQPPPTPIARWSLSDLF